AFNPLARLLIIIRAPKNISNDGRVALTAVSLLSIFLIGGQYKASAQSPKPKISGVQYREVLVDQNIVTVTLEITGEGFGAPGSSVTVALLDASGVSVAQIENTEVSSDNKIIVKAKVPLGTVITSIKLNVQTNVVETSDFKLTFKSPPQVKVTPFEIKYATRKSPQFPNLYSLLVTNDDGKFESNPNRMSVEIVPAGASNVTIRPGVNPFQMIVDFMAPNDFEVKDIIITVYNSADLDNRSPVAIA